jgi:hypothetical protein
VACGFTGNRRALGRALEGVGPTDGPTRLHDAVALARLLLAGQTNGRVLAFTDGCAEGLDALTKAADIDLHPVGRRTGNVGITRFQARRSLRDPTGYQVLIEVGNFSDERVECRLEIERDGLTVDVLPLALAPRETWRHVLDKASTAGGLLTARLDRDDALACDNRAWASLPAREPRPVALIAEGDRFAQTYVERVLESNPLVKQPVELITPPAAESGAEGLRVYYRHVPRTFPPGPVLVLDPAGSCDLWEFDGELREPAVAVQDKASPLLAYVSLDNVVIDEARRLVLEAGAQPRVLAAFTTGEPLLAVFDRPGGPVVVLTAALDDPGDLPLRTAFPILVGNVLSWLEPGAGDLRESAAAGEVVEVRAGGPGWTVRSPDGRERPCPPGERAAVGPLDRCGIWRVGPQGGGPSPIAVACNLANPRESDLRPPSERAAPALPPPGGLIAPPLWLALTLLALVLAIVEWRLYQRRLVT